MLNEYETPRPARDRIRDWFTFYNTKRPHQSLGYQTPWGVLSEGGKQNLSGTGPKIESDSEIFLFPEIYVLRNGLKLS